jgi:hypothetical protein
MFVVAIVAVAVLAGVLLANQPANPQPLPPTTQTTQQDCGCGVPENPRGPR